MHRPCQLLTQQAIHRAVPGHEGLPFEGIGDDHKLEVAFSPVGHIVAVALVNHVESCWRQCVNQNVIDLLSDGQEEEAALGGLGPLYGLKTGVFTSNKASVGTYRYAFSWKINILLWSDPA